MDQDLTDATLELEDLLRELVRQPGIVAAGLGKSGTTVLADETGAGVSERRVALAAGGELVAIVEGGADAAAAGAAIDGATRAVKACLKRLELAAIPELKVIGRAARSKAALLRRIGRFLDAYGGAHGAIAVALLRGPEVVATGGALAPELRDRLAFLRKRLDAEAARGRGKTSHAELITADVYACSFWFGAYLVAFFDRPYPTDFVRHRARAVTRELAMILPHLDDDPPEPVNVNPKP